MSLYLPCNGTNLSVAERYMEGRAKQGGKAQHSGNSYSPPLPETIYIQGISGHIVKIASKGKWAAHTIVGAPKFNGYFFNG